MAALLPPTALTARIGRIEQLAATELQHESSPPMRDRPREYRKLVDALAAQSTTPCAGDSRFTADRPPELHAHDFAQMRAACASCRARTACDTFASAARPAAGFWAGRQYPLAESSSAA